MNRNFDIHINVFGHDNASGVLHGISGALGNMMQFAGGQVIGNAITGGVNMMVDFGKQTLAAGIGFNALEENAKIAFTTIFGDGQKALDFIGSIKDFAAKTPFEFTDLLNYSKGLTSVGIDASRVIPIMTVLGDATSAMGTGSFGIQRAALALQQMGTLGRVTGQDMLQLTQAGIPAWDALAASMGKTIPETQKLVSDGLVPAEQMFKALETGAGDSLKRVSGMMAAQSKSWDGMLSNLKDTFMQTAGEIMKPVFEEGKVWLGKLLDFTQSGAFKAGVSNVVAFLRDGIGAVMPILATGIGFITGNLIPALQMLGEGRWMNAIVELFGVNTGFGLIRLLLPFVDALQARFGMLQNFFVQMLPIAGQFGNWLMANLVPALAQLGTFLLTTVLPPVMQLGDWLTGVILNGVVSLASWIVSALLPALTTMGQTIATAALPTIQLFGGWINSTLLPGIQQLAAFLGPLLQQALAALGNIIVTIVLPALTQLIVWILGQGLPALGDLLNRVGGFVNGLLPTFASLWQQVQENFKKAVKFAQDLGGKLNDLAGVINTAIGPVAKWFNETILQPLLQTLNGLIGAAQSFFYWLGQIAERLASMVLPDFLQRHSPSPLEQALMNSNAYLREMSGLLPKSLGRLNKENLQRKVNEFLAPAQDSLQISAGAPIAAGGASASSGVTFDQRRVFEITGPITIYADDPNSFADALEALGARVYGELSFAG